MRSIFERHQYTENTVSLMEDQLKLSDMIIINKIDLVTDDSLEKIDTIKYDLCKYSNL